VRHLDVHHAVTDHKGMLQIDSMLVARFEKHVWRRLPAVAARVRHVRSIVDIVHTGVVLCKDIFHRVVYRLELVLVKESSADTRLVRDHDHWDAHFVQFLDAIRYCRYQLPVRV